MIPTVVEYLYCIWKNKLNTRRPPSKCTSNMHFESTICFYVVPLQIDLNWFNRLIPYRRLINDIKLKLADQYTKFAGGCIRSIAHVTILWPVWCFRRISINFVYKTSPAGVKGWSSFITNDGSGRHSRKPMNLNCFLLIRKNCYLRFIGFNWLVKGALLRWNWCFRDIVSCHRNEVCTQAICLVK